MTTIDLFTKPFTMPDGGVRRPLVERVQSLPRPPYCTEENGDALLIRAAHEWVSAAKKQESVPESMFLAVWEPLEAFGRTGVVGYLVEACHLIADALEAP